MVNGRGVLPLRSTEGRRSGRWPIRVRMYQDRHLSMAAKKLMRCKGWDTQTGKMSGGCRGDATRRMVGRVCRNRKGSQLWRQTSTVG